MFAHGFSCDIPCQPVEVNCGEDCIQNSIWTLCNKARDHAGEDVAGAACCHSWITCCIHPNSAIPLSNESTMALEYQNQLMLTRESASNVQAIVLHSGAC